MSQPLNPSYIQVRRDLIGMVSRDYRSVLDVGCAQGATAAELMRRSPGARATGIELDEAMAQAARKQLTEVICGDAQQGLETLAARGERFDVILCGDVLEHLVDPWGALRVIRTLCAPHAQVIVSLPNVAHYATLVALLRQRWPYESRGIHDRTHLRWFARGNLPELFNQASLHEEHRITTRRIIERPHPLNARLERHIARVPVLRTLTIFQFLSRLTPR